MMRVLVSLFLLTTFNATTLLADHCPKKMTYRLNALKATPVNLPEGEFKIAALKAQELLAGIDVYSGPSYLLYPKQPEGSCAYMRFPSDTATNEYGTWVEYATGRVNSFAPIWVSDKLRLALEIRFYLSTVSDKELKARTQRASLYLRDLKSGETVEVGSAAPTIMSLPYP